jgi:hypothetical protein
MPRETVGMGLKHCGNFARSGGRSTQRQGLGNEQKSLCEKHLVRRNSGFGGQADYAFVPQRHWELDLDAKYTRHYHPVCCRPVEEFQKSAVTLGFLRFFRVYCRVWLEGEVVSGKRTATAFYAGFHFIV